MIALNMVNLNIDVIRIQLITVPEQEKSEKQEYEH